MTETKVEVSDEPKEVEKKPEVDSTNVKKEEKEEVKTNDQEVEKVKEDDEKVIEKEKEKEDETKEKEDKDEGKKEDEKEIKKEDEEEISGDLTENEKKIIRQIKYYFGDINLPRDKFLKETLKQQEGWVPLDTLLTFQRLKELTQDKKLIISALTKSDSDLIELHEDKTKIRRNPSHPLPEWNEERRKELMNRTVYCKGFPQEGVSLDALFEFFNPYGSIEYIQFRTYNDKAASKTVFKGSVFVLFTEKEKAEEFLKIESVKYKEQELIKKWQETYFEDKKKERLEHRSNQNALKNKAKQEAATPTLAKNAVLLLTGFKGEDILRTDIKNVLNNEYTAEVAYIEFNQGDASASVRLLGEDSAKKILEKFTDGKLKIKDQEVTAAVLEGEEEEKFLEKTRQDLAKAHQRFQANKKRDRGNNRNKRRGGGSGGPPHKRERRN